MKRLLFILFITCSINCYCQTSDAVYIHIQQSMKGGANTSYMVITYPDQTSKNVELVKLGWTGSGAEENGKVIQKE